MSAFFEGFLTGLANPKATKGITQSGSAFYDWFQGEQKKKKAHDDFDESMRDYMPPEPKTSPFGYFDDGTPDSLQTTPPQGMDRAQIESDKMLKHLEKGLRRFMDSGSPRDDPEKYFSGQVTPQGRHVDPTYNRRR